METNESYGRRKFNAIIEEIAKFGGSTHPSLRDSAVDYGVIAGISHKEICDALLEAGVQHEDAVGAIKSSKY